MADPSFPVAGLPRRKFGTMDPPVSATWLGRLKNFLVLDFCMLIASLWLVQFFGLSFKILGWLELKITASFKLYMLCDTPIFWQLTTEIIDQLLVMTATKFGLN